MTASAQNRPLGVSRCGPQSQNPIQVLQYVASSLLGPRSFSGGLACPVLRFSLLDPDRGRIFLRRHLGVTCPNNEFSKIKELKCSR